MEHWSGEQISSKIPNSHIGHSNSFDRIHIRQHNQINNTLARSLGLHVTLDVK